MRVRETPVLEGSPFVIMDKVTNLDADLITQADVSTITYKVSNKVTGSAVSGHNGVSLDVEDVVFDTLQTDSGWVNDELGCNYRHTVSQSATADPGHYEYLATLTLTSGFVLLVRADLVVIGNAGN